jgi:hypothetical protein
MRRVSSTAEWSSFRGQVNDAKLRLGMASFTERNDNAVMPTHYAHNYAEVCIGYLTKRRGSCRASLRTLASFILLITQ